MSQEQPTRSQEIKQPEPIKYGDVFNVSGDLAQKPIAPEDAAMMQKAETNVLGHTQKGGAAATLNENAGAVGHRDVTDAAGSEGVPVAEIDIPRTKIVMKSVGGQVVEQKVESAASGEGAPASITIGEALESLAISAGDRAVDHGDAAAIHAAESRATGSEAVSPGGLSASAMSAAVFNEGVLRDDEKVKLSDVLSGATGIMAVDKAATKEDAEGVLEAEKMGDRKMGVHAGGVGTSIAAAAMINEGTAP